VTAKGFDPGKGDFMRFVFLLKPRSCFLFVLTVLLFSNLPEPGLVQAADAVDIGSRRELFADDVLIEKLTGSARQVIQQPEPKEMVLVTGKPWEGNVSAYFTFLQDGDEFRAYYRGAHYDTVKKVMTHREVTCVATSRDGIHWKKPELDIYDFAGSRKNNIVWDGIGTHCFVLFIDRNPAARKSERYKAISRGRFVTGQFVTPARQKGVTGLYTFSSPDGLHWKRTSEGPVITRGAFDSQNLAFWDANRKKYVCYSRLFIDGVRSIQFCKSSDFVNWTDPVKLAYVASPNEHLYTNAIMPYFRKEIELNPEKPEPYRFLAAALEKQGKFKEAMRQYQELLRLQPGNPETHFQIARLLLHQDRTAEAIRHLRSVLKSKPDHLITLNNLAWLLATHQDDAIRDGDEALRLAIKLNRQTAGKNPHFVSTLAAALAAVGRFEDAARAARKAVSLAKESKQAELVEQIKAQLQQYESGKPYRE